MTTLKSKFSLGDVVYYLRLWTSRGKIDCSLCNTTGVIHPIEEPGRKMVCPGCLGSRKVYDVLRNARWYEVQRLTIGKVEISKVQGVKSESRYMALESGIISGTVYYDDKLYVSHEDAVKAAEALGARPSPWGDHKVEEVQAPWRAGA